MSDQLYFELYIKRARPEIQGNTHCGFIGCVKIKRVGHRERFSKTPDTLMTVNEASNQLNSLMGGGKRREINVHEPCAIELLARKRETSAFAPQSFTAEEQSKIPS